MNNARKKVYLAICAVVTGLLVAWASYCTYANGLSKLSFSVDNDVFEISQSVLDNSEYYSGQRLYYFPLIFKGYNLNYLKVITDIEEPEEPTLTFIGFYTKGEWKDVISVHGSKLKNGINYIELPKEKRNKKRLIGEFVLEGTEKQVIESACLVETDATIDTKGALFFAMKIVGLYYAICIIFAVIKSIQSKKE